MTIEEILERIDNTYHANLNPKPQENNMDKYVVELEEQLNTVDRDIKDIQDELSVSDGSDTAYEDHLLMVLAQYISIRVDIECALEEACNWQPEEPQQYEDY